MRQIIQIITFVVVIATFFPTVGMAQKKQSAIRDTLDNAIDISYYLNNLHGVLPIISPITEPAVGFGAAVAGLYFVPKKDTSRQGFKMPDIVAVAGGLTENKTWFAGGGYIGFWNKDRIRYRGVIGYGEINLKYYGKGGGVLGEHPIDFTINSLFFLQQVLFRLGETRFLLGGKYQLGLSKTTLFKDAEWDFINPRDKDLTNSGIGVIAEYENFNNIFSPSKGLRVNVTYDQFLEFLGSDLQYGRLTLYGLYYHPITSFWTAGFRMETRLAIGDPPFYMMPFVILRGVPAMRYQGEYTVLLETEQEFSLTKRWSLVGFGGYGHAYASLDDFSKYSPAWNAGGGFRYLLARLFGLKMGLDVARGPEQWAVYVVFGSSWMR